MNNPGNEAWIKSQEKAFMKYGQDPRYDNIDLLTAHLASLNENSIYKSLQENQKAFDAI